MTAQTSPLLSVENGSRIRGLLETVETLSDELYEVRRVVGLLKRGSAALLQAEPDFEVRTYEVPATSDIDPVQAAVQRACDVLTAAAEQALQPEQTLKSAIESASAELSTLAHETLQSQRACRVGDVIDSSEGTPMKVDEVVLQAGAPVRADVSSSLDTSQVVEAYPLELLVRGRRLLKSGSPGASVRMKVFDVLEETQP